MRGFAVLAVVAGVLSACGEGRPESVGPDVSSLRVTGEQEQVSAYVAYLSPDGETLLYNSKRGTCVREVGGSAEQCVPRNTRLSAGSAAWSPDGGRLALTDAYGLNLEPDLRVLDVRSGVVTNLTDDGVEAEGDRARVDVYPSWSANGEQIRFVRKESDNAVSLMSIPAGGGEPKRLRSIDTNWERLQQVAWSKDMIAWLSGSPYGGDGEVVVADLSGGEPRKLLVGEYPWAPTGHAIAYIEAPDTVRVVGKPGDQPRDLHRDSELSAADLHNLDWVPGKLLVKRGEDMPVVLSITE